MHRIHWWACVLAVPLFAAGCTLPGTSPRSGHASRVKAESEHTVAAKVSIAAEEHETDAAAKAAAVADRTADGDPQDDGTFVELPQWGDAPGAERGDRGDHRPDSDANGGAMDDLTGGAGDGAGGEGAAGRKAERPVQQAPWWRRAKDAGSAFVPPAFAWPSSTPLPTSTSMPSATPWPTATIPPTPTVDSVAAAGIPVRLEIPAIGVDTVVEHVGLTAERAMDVPKDWMNVAWYENGPLPGAVGNSVIAGHLDTNTGGPAVFWMLNRLAPGDEVIVTYDLGDQYTFIVQELVEYDHDAEGEVIDTVFGESLAPNLNLVTCQGVWDYGNGTYNKRLVVFTALAPELTVYASSGVVRD